VVLLTSDNKCAQQQYQGQRLTEMCGTHVCMCAVLVRGVSCRYRRAGLGETEAVVAGLSQTGHIITAAGVIMAIAFSGLLLSTEPVLNELAFLLVLAVLVDTFIVRSMLVPAIMSAFGRLNWWPQKFKNNHNGATKTPSVRSRSRCRGRQTACGRSGYYSSSVLGRDCPPSNAQPACHLRSTARMRVLRTVVRGTPGHRQLLVRLVPLAERAVPARRRWCLRTSRRNPSARGSRSSQTLPHPKGHRR
jgi:hypothetical protein